MTPECDFLPLNTPLINKIERGKQRKEMFGGKEMMWGAGPPPPMVGRGGGLTLGSAMPQSMTGASMMPTASPSTNGSGAAEKPPLCKYFVNGGCLRGDSCGYLHELPDERHLDVNGLGFILHSNVHNAQKTVQTAPVSGPAAGTGVASGLGGGMIGGRKLPAMKRGVMPRYRPPEPCLEHNLPPALALPFNTSSADVLQTLLVAMLDAPASGGMRH